MPSPEESSRYDGLGASEGIAIGRSVCIEHRAFDVTRFDLEPGTEEIELERFRRSVDRAQEIRETGHRVREQLGNELAAIFEAHSLFLTDRLFLERIEERIRTEGVNAEWAVHRTASDLGERFADLESTYLGERGEDLQDVSRYLLRSLQDQDHRDLSDIDGEIIVIASDLTPSDAVRLGRQGVVGFAIETGGQTSHTAIIARSLHIPLVVGLPGITARVVDEDWMIVDGGEGSVFLHPSAATVDSYRERQRTDLIRRRELVATREVLEAETVDGLEVTLLANIDLPEEIDEALSFGVKGVGLYRSEFLYIERSPDLPTEEEQIDLYRHLLTSMAPHPVTVRTFDLGGRKLAREVMGTAESNPVLGLRGIRLTMARPKIFRIQLRALYRAAIYGELRIMLPMVSTLGEVRSFKRFAATVLEELAAEGLEHRADVKVGIMIEVPSAAVVADVLASEVEFFSIGTNDLIQYSLAVDRNNEHVNYLYKPSHPAILRMIRFVVDSARKAGIDVTICGEMAGDPDNTALLLGLGLRQLSIGPHTVPSVKARIRSVSAARCREVVDRCLESPTADAVEEALKGVSVEA